MYLYVRYLEILQFFFFQTELSHNLQQLSERARSTTEFIQRLKGMSDKVNVSIKIAFIMYSITDYFLL